MGTNQENKGPLTPAELEFGPQDGGWINRHFDYNSAASKQFHSLITELMYKKKENVWRADLLNSKKLKPLRKSEKNE
jgi:hypothetical protein